LPGGFVGVDVFFIISGYVVSASLGRDAGRSLLDLLQRFYARRVVRIVPALVARLLATFATCILFIPQCVGSAIQFIEPAFTREPRKRRTARKLL
jgi:peptidoglycan/LPS O-acetylase OafA/YrhL